MQRFCLHRRREMVGVSSCSFFLLATVDSCTTLVNRRDLYSPEPGTRFAGSGASVVRRHNNTHDGQRRLGAKTSFSQWAHVDIS
jgi:hypothetical protein